MKLYFEQIEEKVKNLFQDEYGEVCDPVMGMITFFGAKKAVSQKDYTMADLLKMMRQLPGVPEDEQGPHAEVEKLEKYWTRENFRPKDMRIDMIYLSKNLQGIVIRWDFTEAWKERTKKRSERRDQRLKEQLTAIKKKKGGK